MAFTQETLPKTPEEAGELMAQALLEKVQDYRYGELDSFQAVFCPGNGQPIHDVGLNLFLEGLDIQDIDSDSGFLVLEDGVKLFFHELVDHTDGRMYQITFASEPLAI